MGTCCCYCGSSIRLPGWWLVHYANKLGEGRREGPSTILDRELHGNATLDGNLVEVTRRLLHLLAILTLTTLVEHVIGVVWIFATTSCLILSPYVLLDLPLQLLWVVTMKLLVTHLADWATR